MILGIDEVGRGPWAGPLVVGAVVLGDKRPDGLTDSKRLTKKRREDLYDLIINMAESASTGWVSAKEIDQIGLSEALRLATRRAVEGIHGSYSEIIIDGTVNFLSDTSKGRYVTTLAKADLLIPSVSAASIIAKVERDRYMASQDDIYPDYEFRSHSGYGVAKHRQAIELNGVTPLHRLSFAPLAKYRPATFVAKKEIIEPVITTKQIGDQAETSVSEWLEGQGHEVICRNWRTRWCEIDIVSCFQGTVYFTEVKYRSNLNYGDGLSAITPTKLRQMKFAAEYFALKNKVSDQISLAAASVSGDDFTCDDWFEIND